MLEILKYLETKTEKYPMAFTFNVMEKIQEKYGSIISWQHKIFGEKEIVKKDENGVTTTKWETTGEPDLRAIKFCVTEMINEGIDIENETMEKDRSFISEKKVGRIVTEIGIKKMIEKIFELVEKSNGEGEKN